MLQEGDSIQRPLLLSLSVFFASLSDISLGWLSIIIGIYDIWSYPIIWPKVLFCVNEFLTLSVNLCNQVLVLKSKKVIIKASSKIIRGRSRSWSRAGSITLIFVVAGCTNIIEKLSYVFAVCLTRLQRLFPMVSSDGGEWRWSLRRSSWSDWEPWHQCRNVDFTYVRLVLRGRETGENPN
jgi:hypothetical protein